MVQVVSNRPVPSRSGKTEEYRPPGERPGSVRTSLTDKRACAGPWSPAFARFAWPISTKAAVSIDTGSPPCSVPWKGFSNETTRPSSAGRGARNWIAVVPVPVAWLFAP